MRLLRGRDTFATRVLQHVQRLLGKTLTPLRATPEMCDVLLQAATTGVCVCVKLLADPMLRALRAHNGVLADPNTPPLTRRARTTRG